MNLRRTLVVIAAGVGLGLGAASVAQAYPGFTTGTVNVRTGPSTAYQKIAALPRGTAIDVRFCRPSWCQVGYWGGVGWVSARYISAGAPGPRYGQPSVGFFFRFGSPPRRWHPPTYSPWPLPGPWW